MLLTRLVVVVAAVLFTTAAAAQTHSETLERGIFTEESAGDLDGAITIYEGLLRNPGIPPAIAVRAQARLADVRERQPAPRVAAVQPSLARVADASPQNPAPSGVDCCPDNYNLGSSAYVSGPIVKVEWIHPLTVIYVKGDDGNLWGFTLTTPNDLIRWGWNRNTARPGSQVLISGYLAKGTGDDCPGPLPNACATFADGARHAMVSTIVMDGKAIFDRLAFEEQARRQREGSMPLSVPRPVPR